MSVLLRMMSLSRLSKSRRIFQKNIIKLPAASTLFEESCIHSRCLQTSIQKSNEKKQATEGKKNSIDDPPIITFKTTDVKKIFKQFYSLYGPLFVACHITISLASLGTLCTIVWLNFDLAGIIPQSLWGLMSETIMTLTEGGGKFVIAYAIHKLLLPLRLGGAIFLTKKLSPRVKAIKESFKLGK